MSYLGVTDPETLSESVPDIIGLPSEDYVLQWSGLHIEQDEDEQGNAKYWDINDQEISDEAINDLVQAAADALISGAEQTIVARVHENLSRLLETFNQYKYEYPYYDDEGNLAHQSGTAHGIVGQDIEYETTTLELHPDIVHVINDNIAGYGEFDVDNDLYGYSIEQFVDKYLHHLGDFWEIYGVTKPRPDFDDIDEVDSGYFKELVSDIEKEYDISILY